MTHLFRIYAPWGHNAEQMASAIGERPVTVRQWRNRGRIPEKYWRKIITYAAEKGVELKADDFLPDVEGNNHGDADTSLAGKASSGTETNISAPSGAPSSAVGLPGSATTAAEGEGACSLPGGLAA